MLNYFVINSEAFLRLSRRYLLNSADLKGPIAMAEQLVQGHTDLGL